MLRVRIGDVEFRQKEDYFEVVKWYANTWYGKKNEFTLEDGKYKHHDMPLYLQEESFTTPEFCYTLAKVRRDVEEWWKIEEISTRVIDLQDEDLIKYKQVIKLGTFEYERSYENVDRNKN